MLESDPTARTVTEPGSAPAGIMLSAPCTTSLPRYQPFLGIPGIVAVIDAVVAAAVAGIAGLAVGAGVARSLAAGAAVFALTLWLFVRWASSKIAAWGHRGALSRAASGRSRPRFLNGRRAGISSLGGDPRRSRSARSAPECAHRAAAGADPRLRGAHARR
jgi:hypothetical protein